MAFRTEADFMARLRSGQACVQAKLGDHCGCPANKQQKDSIALQSQQNKTASNMMIRHFRFVLDLATVAVASPIDATFKTKCTFPNTTTHYVSSPDSRGSLNILWSCLFTIIACTLTIQHLNVPEQRDGCDPGWWGDVKWMTKDTLKSLKWMIITILAPEVMIAKGWSDLVAAKNIDQALRVQAAKDGVPWTLTHTFFANMGGFVIRVSQPYDPSHLRSAIGSDTASAEGTDSDVELVQLELAQSITSLNTLDTTRATHTRSVTQTASIEASSITTSEHSTSSASAPEGLALSPPTSYHLVAKDIINLREAGQLSKLPHITQDEINDKSKSNTLVKTIAVTQILWMIVQIPFRAAQRLAVTPLEVSVVAFSVCAIIIYFLNWQKPKDVKIAYALLHLPGELPPEMVRVLREPRGSTYVFGLFRAFPFVSVTIRPGAPIPNDFEYGDVNDPKEDNWQILVGLLLGCVIFGGIHVAAWAFDFPTRIEVILWRAASSWCAGFAIVCNIFTVFIGDGLFKCFGLNKRWFDRAFALLVCSYILGRLILLVEMFRSLLFLPPSAFMATSASNIPHVA
ncbi:hypothetical protein N431DRAFT_561241 [Stipitochalara longipes BDJ]|nr:hypothetical protein N431DRAFT_561241 [Stipitochalara longipes BDJ]